MRLFENVDPIVTGRGVYLKLSVLNMQYISEVNETMLYILIVDVLVTLSSDFDFYKVQYLYCSNFCTMYLKSV